MTGLIQRLLNRAAAVPASLGQVSAAGPSASPLAKYDQRLGSGLVDDAGLGIGPGEAPGADAQSLEWWRPSAAASRARDSSLDGPAEGVRRTSDPLPISSGPAESPLSPPAAPSTAAQVPATPAAGPPTMRHPMLPKIGPVDPGATPPDDPDVPHRAEPERSDLPQTVTPPLARPESEPARTMPTPAPERAFEEKPARQIATPDAPLPVADPHMGPAAEPPANDPVAMVPDPVPPTDQPQPGPMPQLATPVATAPPFPPEAPSRDMSTTETRIVERVVREVPAEAPKKQQPKGPLTAESVSKIGKLPERRRIHTLFGQRRR